jgi:hypothetical protein
MSGSTVLSHRYIKQNNRTGYQETIGIELRHSICTEHSLLKIKYLNDVLQHNYNYIF